MTDTLERSLQFNTKDASVVTKAVDGADEEEDLIRVPISSTSTDRDGDEFSQRGLENLRDQINRLNVPVFGNHGRGDGGLLGVRYDWKSMLGTQVEAEIEDDMLFSYVRPNRSHPDGDGELLVDMVEEGQAVGFSVGFRATDYEEKETGEDNFVFHAADLMESSAVGIQSNPDAVAQAMAKGVGDLDGVDVDEAALATELVAELDTGEGKRYDPSSDNYTRDAPELMSDETADTVLEKLDTLDDEIERLHDRFDDLTTPADTNDADGEKEAAEPETETPDSPEPSKDGIDADRLAELETEVADLRDALTDTEVDDPATTDTVDKDADADTTTQSEGFL
jgi:HK97 family phage prohead protease